MNHRELIDNWNRMDKAAVDGELIAVAMSAMSDEIERLQQRAEAAEAKLAVVAMPNENQWVHVHVYGQMLADVNRLTAECDAVTKRAEAAEQALQLATNSTPGKGTGVWVPLDKWTELQAQLAAVTAERDAAVNHAQRAEIKLTNAWPRSDVMQLMQDVDDIIGGLDISNTAGAINWGDLGAAEAQIVWTEHFTWHYRVIIEEAEEECRALIDNVLAGLTARKWMGVEIETRW